MSNPISYSDKVNLLQEYIEQEEDIIANDSGITDTNIKILMEILEDLYILEDLQD